MLIEIKVPSVGESVTEALLAQWFKNDGDPVKKDEPLFVIETDKVTLEVVAEADGVLSIQVAEGETVAIGAVVGTLDSEGAARPDAAPTVEATEETGKDASAPPAEPVKPDKPEQQPPEPEAPAPVPRQTIHPADSELHLTPAVRRLVAEKNLDPTLIPGTGPDGRITKGDVVLYLENDLSSDSVTQPVPPAVPAAAPVDLAHGGLDRLQALLGRQPIEIALGRQLDVGAQAVGPAAGLEGLDPQPVHLPRVGGRDEPPETEEQPEEGGERPPVSTASHFHQPLSLKYSRAVGGSPKRTAQLPSSAPPTWSRSRPRSTPLSCPCSSW